MRTRRSKEGKKVEEGAKILKNTQTPNGCLLKP